MVYIEIILLVNALIHILLVKNTHLILGKKINVKLLVISTLLTSIYMVTYLLKPYLISNVKLPLILLISTLCFIKSIKQVVQGGILYLSQNFMLGGFAQILYNIISFNIIYLLSILVLSTIITYIYKYNAKYNVSLSNLNYNIKIIHNDIIYHLKAYCDTGNFLTDEVFIPIVFLNKKFKIGTKHKDINCHTVSMTRKIALYKVDSFYILIDNKYIKKDVYIAFSNINFEVLFGLNLLGG